jgi:hypothetical protein
MTATVPLECPACRSWAVYLDDARSELRCHDCEWSGVWPDHPYTDPGDGRQQCSVCGKWVHLVTHSCKGVRVAPPQFRVIEGGGQ